MTGDDRDGRTTHQTPLHSVHRLEFDVPWRPKHVATYLIEPATPTDDRILIDAGTPGEDGADTLRTGLDALGYEPADVDHVLLTHPHTDHTGQIATLREAGATVHAPREMLDQLERDEESLSESARAAARGAGFPDEQLDAVVERAVDSLRRNRDLVHPERCRAVSRDEPFTIGGREFAPIHTPGHQIHQTCFETTVEGRRVLFSGDALIEPFRPVIIHVGMDHGAYEGADAFYTAMDRLDGVDATLALPGHGPTFTDLQAVVDDTRASLDDLVEKTATALERVAPATPIEVATERFGHLEDPMNVLDVMAALGSLDAAGRASYDLEEGVRYYRPN